MGEVQLAILSKLKSRTCIKSGSLAAPYMHLPSAQPTTAQHRSRTFLLPRSLRLCKSYLSRRLESNAQMDTSLADLSCFWKEKCSCGCSEWRLRHRLWSGHEEVARMHGTRVIGLYSRLWYRDPVNVVTCCMCVLTDSQRSLCSARVRAWTSFHHV